MYIQQLYTGCLAQAAYYIESEGEAAIVDPLRDIGVYLEMATARNAKIKYIFETHFHADFVSGHIDIAKHTGATIVYGPTAAAGYNIKVADDNEEFKLGNISIKVIHTPGHTLESSCFLVLDENKKPHALFSGDTLFVGDVGRVDLAASHYLSKEELASMLFDSVEKLKKLPDDVIVYPGHGAGSACGKNIGKETTTTIGEQKKHNYALQEMNKETFVNIMLNGLEAPPRYFFMDAVINRKGYQDSVDSIVAYSRFLTPLEFKIAKDEGTIVLDTRKADDYAVKHIPGSINIGLNGQYAIWAGTIFDNVAFLLVCEEGKEKESVLRLARVGYDKIAGVLNGGMAAWEKEGLPVQSLNTINAAAFETLPNENKIIIDVRNESEHHNGIVEGALTIPLANLERELIKLNKKEHYYVYCAGGYRSMIASSILQHNGFDVTNINGGMGAISKTSVKIEVPEVV
jgi:glyoxylase-like metal-dependent hydrolase (beta-lactamase superfamily II)/rhodanese-related sulfurtransferase